MRVTFLLPAVAGLLVISSAAPTPASADTRNAPVQLPSSLAAVSDMLAGPNQSLWFVAPEVDKIGVLFADGAITEIPLPSGSRPGNLELGAEGSVWFTDSARPVIGRVSAEGQILEVPLPRSHDRAGAVAPVADGSVWATLTSSAELVHITSAGSQVHELPPSFAPATDLIMGPDARPWFVDAVTSALGTVSPDGSLSEVPLSVQGHQAIPAALTVGADGRLWFADTTGRLGSTDLAGVGEWTNPRTTGAHATQPVLGPDARIWFTDTAHHRLGWVKSNGELAVTELPHVSTPSVLAAGAGVLWVGDADSGLIVSLSPPLAELPLADPTRELLLSIGGALVILALIAGLLIALIVFVTTRARRTPRPRDFTQQLALAAPVDLTPRPVPGARLRNWRARVAARLFRDEGRDGAVDLSRWLVLTAFAVTVFAPNIAALIPSGLSLHVELTLLCALSASIGVGVASRCARVDSLEGIAALQTRASLTAESLVLVAIGLVLSSVNGPYSSVVLTLGIVMILTFPFVRARRWVVALLACASAVLGPVILFVAPAVSDGPAGNALALVRYGQPAGLVILLVGAALTGLLLCRNATRIRAGARLALVGLGLAVVGWGIPVGVGLTVPQTADALRLLQPPDGFTGPWLSEVAGLNLGTVSPLLVVGCSGAGLVILGLAQLLWWPLRWVLFPLVSAGSLSLTVWSAGLVLLAWLPNGAQSALVRNALVFYVAAILLATVWKIFFTHGPLEWLLAVAARRAGALGRIHPGSASRVRHRDRAIALRARSSWTADGRRPIRLSPPRSS